MAPIGKAVSNAAGLRGLKTALLTTRTDFCSALSGHIAPVVPSGTTWISERSERSTSSLEDRSHGTRWRSLRRTTQPLLRTVGPTPAAVASLTRRSGPWTASSTPPPFTGVAGGQSTAAPSSRPRDLALIRALATVLAGRVCDQSLARNSRRRQHLRLAYGDATSG
ncbi:hypothetical protein Purlil1_11813 [Purpureocillium lilacinum]|uniref:Uncharacterized protein n=1 Tax=Purpureocillium lilacinum TaxID=33203 RepID=A0ABR0BIT1_PURLI|nr:hypothetical protein Purlil1_11813 [Purpureocillium lilacinum]